MSSKKEHLDSWAKRIFSSDPPEILHKIEALLDRLFDENTTEEEREQIGKEFEKIHEQLRAQSPPHSHRRRKRGPGYLIILLLRKTRTKKQN